MTSRPPTGGTGSNQYATKPGAITESPDRVQHAAMLHTLTDPASTRVTPTRTEMDEDTQRLRALARSGRVDDRAAAAGHPHSPPDVLEHLGADPEPSIRLRVAANPATPPETLERLGEENWKTKRVVIRNPNCPVRVLEDAWRSRTGLAAHAVPDLITGLCTNPSTPPTVLTAAVETSVDARRVVPSRRWAPPEALLICADHTKTAKQLAPVINNPAFPPDQMARYVGRKKDLDVWRAVAHNPNSPPEMLTKAARHADPTVRTVAATNPNISDGDLENLLFDSDPMVKKAATSRELPEHLEAAVAFAELGFD